MITWNCRQCGESLEAPESAASETMECPKCGIPTKPGSVGAPKTGRRGAGSSGRGPGSHGARYSYEVRLVSQGVLGTLLLGRSRIRAEAVSGVLNEMGSRGYRNTFQVLESRRFLIFWQRETLIITFERSV